MSDSEKLDALRLSLSNERLHKYLQASNESFLQAIHLYERNMRLSEAFYTPLQCLEICLRNKLHGELTNVYGVEWYRHTSTGLHEMAVRKVESAVTEIKNAKRSVTPGAVVAELSFGLWVALLAPQYDATLWRKALAKAFRPNGRGLKRDLVHGRMNALRRFRNRVAHHEPIFQRELSHVHAELIEAIAWMCPKTAEWTVSASRVDDVIRSQVQTETLPVV